MAKPSPVQARFGCSWKSIYNFKQFMVYNWLTHATRLVFFKTFIIAFFLNLSLLANYCAKSNGKKNKFWVRISASISNLNLVCLAENLTFFLRHKLTGFNRQGFSQFSMRIWLSKKCFQMCSCVSLLCSSKSTRQSLTVEVRRQIMFNNSGKVGFNCNFESYQLCMRVQCVQIWRNFTTLEKFMRVYLVFGKKLNYLGKVLRCLG